MTVVASKQPHSPVSSLHTLPPLSPADAGKHAQDEEYKCEEEQTDIQVEDLSDVESSSST